MVLAHFVEYCVVDRKEPIREKISERNVWNIPNGCYSYCFYDRKFKNGFPVGKRLNVSKTSYVGTFNTIEKLERVYPNSELVRTMKNGHYRIALKYQCDKETYWIPIRA